MPDDDPSKLDYAEVQNQLQILEHIAQKRPLSPADAALQRQLEARENDLVQAKLSQSFTAPHSAEDIDNIDPGKRHANTLPSAPGPRAWLIVTSKMKRSWQKNALRI